MKPPTPVPCRVCGESVNREFVQDDTHTACADPWTEVERLQRWKNEALEVLAAWDQVADLVETVNDLRPGSSRADNAHRFVQDAIAQQTTPDVSTPPTIREAVLLRNPQPDDILFITPPDDYDLERREDLETWIEQEAGCKVVSLPPGITVAEFQVSDGEPPTPTPPGLSPDEREQFERDEYYGLEL